MDDINMSEAYPQAQNIAYRSGMAASGSAYNAPPPPPWMCPQYSEQDAMYHPQRGPNCLRPWEHYAWPIYRLSDDIFPVVFKWETERRALETEAGTWLPPFPYYMTVQAGASRRRTSEFDLLSCSALMLM